jgi:REP element-mobilizing transposase RayT
MSRRSPQLSLSLPAHPTWGGRREGAGRKPGERASLPHRSRQKFRVLPAHVTLRLRSDVPSLRITRIVHAIERTFAAGCIRSGFRLVHYSLQGNHAHLIVEAHDRDALGRGMKAIGARLALAVNRIAGRKGRVLAERYHVRLLPTPKQVRNALRYVLLNAQHHATKARRAMNSAARIRSRDAVVDPASSARWFDGWRRGRIPTPERAGPLQRPAVARARTWLLSVGWRRHGLLDPADVPG